MKKFVSLAVLLAMIVSLSACSFLNKNSDPPIPADYDNAIKDTEDTPDDTVSTDGDEQPNEDDRNNPEVIRQEISNLLRDAETLINDGLYDDAKSVLKNLRSRDLTSAEKEKADALSSRLITISD